MRLLLINPNSTTESTAAMAAAARGLCGTDVTVTERTAERSLPSIDGHYDDVIAAAAVCEILAAEKGKHDAAIIACFDDPGLYAARELWDEPVVGIGEASMLLALTVGHRFGILTTLDRGVPLLDDLVVRLGVRSRCAAIVATDIEVSALGDSEELTLQALEARGREAVGLGADVLCLGCGSMVGLHERLGERLGVTVIDPLSAGVALAQSLVAIGARTSKVRAFKLPELQ